MNHFIIMHDHKYGEDSVHFNTNFTYEELDNVIGPFFGAGGNGLSEDVYNFYQKSACKKLCDALGIDFEPWREDEFIELHVFDENIINLDEKLPTLPQDDGK